MRFFFWHSSLFALVYIYLRTHFCVSLLSLACIRDEGHFVVETMSVEQEAISINQKTRWNKKWFRHVFWIDMVEWIKMGPKENWNKSVCTHAAMTILNAGLPLHKKSWSFLLLDKLMGTQVPVAWFIAANLKWKDILDVFICRRV